MPKLGRMITAVVGIVIGVSLTPTIWTAIYDDAIGAGINGTAKTLLMLVPFIYVGVVVIGSCVYAFTG